MHTRKSARKNPSPVLVTKGGSGTQILIVSDDLSAWKRPSITHIAMIGN